MNRRQPVQQAARRQKFLEARIGGPQALTSLGDSSGQLPALQSSRTRSGGDSGGSSTPGAFRGLDALHEAMQVAAADAKHAMPSGRNKNKRRGGKNKRGAQSGGGQPSGQSGSKGGKRKKGGKKGARGNQSGAGGSKYGRGPTATGGPMIGGKALGEKAKGGKGGTPGAFGKGGKGRRGQGGGGRGGSSMDTTSGVA